MDRSPPDGPFHHRIPRDPPVTPPSPRRRAAAFPVTGRFPGYRRPHGADHRAQARAAAQHLRIAGTQARHARGGGAAGDPRRGQAAHDHDAHARPRLRPRRRVPGRRGRDRRRGRPGDDALLRRHRGAEHPGRRARPRGGAAGRLHDQGVHHDQRVRGVREVDRGGAARRPALRRGRRPGAHHPRRPGGAAGPAAPRTAHLRPDGRAARGGALRRGRRAARRCARTSGGTTRSTR